ncbi:GNAT family N-acetyltransferase [Pseudomonas cichorii]|nr:GNAT family N-acetyltransferase/peptidase C39 family protein [Pseudomonas cichorii]GFM48842.1 GNAT family N-acetyltransferase [Pseudomonas cichorii]
MNINYRFAVAEDIPALELLENQCFEQDRLSRRNFLWMIQRAHARLLVAEDDKGLMGYALVLFHRGTSLARLYSLAIDSRARGSGLGMALLQQAEQLAIEQECAHLRLEVRPDNPAAIRLYERAGYRLFAEVDDYYQDHARALRYEKRIVLPVAGSVMAVPYYPQTTEFTCGAASLLMAMKALNPDRAFSRDEEIQLWREATTIFMTSGHGGCSPHGMALAAWRRGFDVRLHVSRSGPLFLDGVRREDKKSVMRLVHDAFCRELQASGVQQSRSGRLDLPGIVSEGGVPIVLISSYRLTHSKAPHWVVITGCDEDFVYLHDPDLDHGRYRQRLDCQHVPLTHREFERMSVFGKDKIRAALVLF